MQEKNSKESSGLGALDCRGIAAGQTKSVYDESPTLVRDYVPTRKELESLACLYYEQASSIELDWLITGGAGASVRCERAFAMRRLETIRNILGDEQIDDATSDVREKWDATFAGSSARRIYVDGS